MELLLSLLLLLLLFIIIINKSDVDLIHKLHCSDCHTKKKPLLWRNKSQADLQCILGIVCLQIFMQIIFSERFKCRGDVFCLTSSFISCILPTVIIHLLLTTLCFFYFIPADIINPKR